jgi:hypothetical protein
MSRFSGEIGVLMEGLLERVVPLLDPEEVAEADERVALLYRASLAPPSRIVFTTKNTMAEFLLGDVDEPLRDIVLVRASPMLPVYSRIVASELARVAVPLQFVGDLDPEDLCTFFTLREQLMSFGVTKSDISYLGIGDAWLSLCEASSVGRLPTLVFSRSEGRLLDLLYSNVEDFEDTVGRRSCALLQKGVKLELDGALNPAFYKADFEGLVRRHLRDNSNSPPRQSVNV